MANIILKGLISEAEDFKAKSKETGKLVHFKSKDSYQAALKAGTHEDPKSKKSSSSKSTKPNDMFGGDYAKDRGADAPKADSMATVNSIAAKTGLRAQAVAGWADENGVNLSKVSADINSKKLKPMDFMTAVSGNPGNKYAKDIVAKYSQSASPKSNMGVDKVVYNTRTKTVGIVRMADERGETKTDADGNVNTSELEPYNPMKYPHQKDAKVAPSTKKEVDKRGLYNPFAQDKETSKEEPTSKPKEARKGNPSVNKEAKKNAETFGITPQKLGNDGYKKVMLQAAVEALTDANFHDEARELISKIEGKPEWAKRVDYPSMDDPKYKEKMADIRTNGVDSSEYWRGDNNAHEFGRKVSSASGWDGVDAADGIAFTLRMNGFHKEANMIQSVFDDKPYMREQTITKKTNENKMKHISLKALLEAEDFQARSKQTGKLVHFKSKDAYQAALKAGSHEDPKAKKGDEPKVSAKPNDMFGGDYAKDRGDDGFGYGPENDRTPATSLPKKASQLNDKHASVVADTLNKETGLNGHADIDDNTGAIRFTASKGDEPTYTLFIGSNEDYGKPNEFRVSFESTYGEDPSGFGDNIDKSFKTAEEAMAFAKKVAKKFKNELELDDNIRFRQDYNMYDDEDTDWMNDDTNESTKLKSMFRK